MRKRLLIILGVLAMVTGALAIFGETQAKASVSPEHLNPRITVINDYGYDGSGGALVIENVVGANAYFSTTTAGSVAYELLSGGLYWMHPVVNGQAVTSHCLTESTTQAGVLKTEDCVFPVDSWQEWINEKNPANSSEYKNVNGKYSNFITDPTNGDGTFVATLGNNGAWGENGSTMLQAKF